MQNYHACKDDSHLYQTSLKKERGFVSHIQRMWLNLISWKDLEDRVITESYVVLSYYRSAHYAPD